MKAENTELHLFIVWERAQLLLNEIVKDIEKKFRIVEVSHILWDEDNFSRNISRFYGQKLPKGSGKELECGNKRFSLIVVLDDSPRYMERNTSKGLSIVNVNMFDSKTLYRKWTNGGHKVHATDNIKETKHDLFLLLGKKYDEYIKVVDFNVPKVVSEKRLNKNLIGCIQWDSLSQLFEAMNQVVEYVVLRNFDGMPNSYYSETHGDIDLLVSGNPTEIAYLINAVPVYSQKYRVHYKVNINNETVRFDIRYVGDNYYDANWQRSILKNRVMRKGFYVPSVEEFKYSLLYHALVHKPYIAPDYERTLLGLGFTKKKYFDELDMFIKKRGYVFIEPNDLSVYYNAKLIAKSVTYGRKLIMLKNMSVDFLIASLSSKLKLRIKSVVYRFR